MGVNGRATERAFTTALADRPVRYYPAVLSTEATAQGWARQGAPAGAVVVAAYQASPRGRAGRPVELDPDRHLGFSLIVRPGLTPEREGWLYTVATVGLATELAEDVHIHWPDVLTRDERVVADVGVHAELGPSRVDWAVVTAVVDAGDRTRPTLLRDLVSAIERTAAAPPDEVLHVHRERCATLGDEVRAMMIPMGPGGPRIEGTAVDLREDGSLVVATPAGGRVAVRPQHLGELQPRDDAAHDDGPT